MTLNVTKDQFLEIVFKLSGQRISEWQSALYLARIGIPQTQQHISCLEFIDMVESVQNDQVTCLEVFKRMFVIDGEGISNVSKLRIERVLTQHEMFILRGDK